MTTNGLRRRDDVRSGARRRARRPLNQLGGVPAAVTCGHSIRVGAQIVAFEDLRDGFAHEGLGRALEPRCRRQRRQHLVIVTEPQTIVCEGRLDNTREVVADRLECRRDAVHTSILMGATDIQSPDQKVENGL